MAQVARRHDGVTHGTVMFSLSVALLLAILAGTALTGSSGVSGTAHTRKILGIFSDLGWAGFLCLFLGWLAAMAGASAEASSAKLISAGKQDNVEHLRPAV
jgi:hypothetical protein